MEGLLNDGGWGHRTEALRSRPEFRGPIEPVGRDVPDHLALIYETPEQQFEAVVPFIQQGLARDEHCLYIAGDHEEDDITDALRAGGIDVDDARDDGALTVRSITDTYRTNGEFDADETIRFYVDAIEDAVTEYEALRVTAETGWIAENTPLIEEFLEYEARVNEVFHGAPGIALCQYNRERFPDEVISEVIETHPHIVYEQTISQNVYYTPPERSLNGERQQSHAHDPDRKLGVLLDISDTLHEQQSHTDFLRDLHLTVADSERSFEERLHELARRGCERFDHELGVLARIDPNTGGYEVEYTTGDHEYFQPGATLPLSETYCTAALGEKEITEVPGVAEPEDTGVHVLREFGIQTYLGTYIRIDGGHNRVFFFVSSCPENTAVSDSELAFNYLLGRLVKYDHEMGQHRLSHEPTSPPGEPSLVNELVRETVPALIEESTRSDIERTVCDRLAASEIYEAAWIGEQPLTGEEVNPTARAGINEESVEAFLDTSPDRNRSSFVESALESHEPEVARVQDDPAFAPFRRQLLEQGIESVVALPVEYNDLCYGVLVVCAGEPDPFDECHRDVLADLGTVIGFTIAAVNRKEALVTDEIVELELRISDPEFCFNHLTAETDVTVTLDGLIMQPDGSSIAYTTATGASAETIQEFATDVVSIEHTRLIDEYERDDQQEARFEFVLPSSTMVETFAEYGAAVTDATGEGGEATLIVELPKTVNVRAVVNAFQAEFSDSTVVAKRTRDRPGAIARAIQHDLGNLLTDKQRAVLRTAYFAGYFDRPRRTTGDELADTLDISSSTFHQHLQTALRKLLSTTFDEENT